MIIGFPYQDENTIWQEFEQLMALEPGLTQCLIYFAFPGTPFHEQVIAENRYLERYKNAPDLRRWDGFAMHFEHPRFERPEQVEALQRAIYQQDFERLGPSPLRLARVWLTGYENLKNDPNPLLRKRAERQRQDIRGILPVISATIAFGPSDVVRERAMRLRADIIRLTGEPDLKEKMMSTGAPALYLASRLGRALGLLQQPGLLRTQHRMGGRDGGHSKQVFRLQGAALSQIPRALGDDLIEAARRTLAARRPTSGRPEQSVVTTRPQPLRRSLPLVHEPLAAE
jgi:hypothetical protein